MEFFEPELFRIFDRSTQSPEPRSDDRPRDDAFERLLNEAAAADARNEAAADKRRDDARYDEKRAAREASTTSFDSSFEAADAEPERPQAAPSTPVEDGSRPEGGGLADDRPSASRDASTDGGESASDEAASNGSLIDDSGSTASQDAGGAEQAETAAAEAAPTDGPVAGAGDLDLGTGLDAPTALTSDLAAALRELRALLAAIASDGQAVSLEDAADLAAANGDAIDAETLALVDALLVGDLPVEALIAQSPEAAQSPEVAQAVLDALAAMQAALSALASGRSLADAAASSEPDLGSSIAATDAEAREDDPAEVAPQTSETENRSDADGLIAETAAVLTATPANAAVASASVASIAPNAPANVSTVAPVVAQATGLSVGGAPAAAPVAGGDAGTFAQSDGDGTDNAGADRNTASKNTTSTAGARLAQQAFSDAVNNTSSRPSSGAVLTPNAAAALEAAARSLAPPPPPPVSLGVEAGVQGAGASSNGGVAATAASPTGVNTPSAPSAPAQTFAASTPPAIQLASQIADAVRINQNNIQIRMSPAELGNVRVAVQVTGKAMLATVVVERAETLDLLQQDARTLVRALTQLGFELDERDIAFMLEDEAEQGRLDRGLDDDAAQGDSDVQDDAPDGDSLAESYGVERLTPMDGVVDMRV